MKPLVVMLVVVAGACAPVRGYDYRREPDPRRSEYVIGPADMLSIHVWKTPEVSREVTVRPDGTITLPLVGDVAAAGRTPTELTTEISRRLGTFVRDEASVVTVAVTAVNSYRVTVTGNVERPGIITSQRYLTVLEAVQMAGGPNRFARAGGTKLLRRGPDGRLRVIPIDYPAVLEGKLAEANLALLSGDQLHVP